MSAHVGVLGLCGAQCVAVPWRSTATFSALLLAPGAGHGGVGAQNVAIYYLCSISWVCLGLVGDLPWAYVVE